MPTTLNKINISGFRGATSKAEIVFDPSKSVTMVFGENGTGKSTITDAFDFICNGRLGSLESYSLGGNAKKYIASLGTNASDLSVSLTCNGHAWSASLGKDKPVITPPTGCPDARILRRSNILELINAQPKERFEALKKFITVPGIEKSENTLREAIRTTEASFNELVRAFEQASEGLNKLWEAEGKLGKSAIHWAEAEIQKDISTLQATVQEIDKIIGSIQGAETSLTPLDTAVKAQTLAEKAYEDALANQKQAEEKQTQKNSALVSLLKDAKNYVTQKNEGKCPICEQNVDPSLLLSRLSERIEEMKELSTIVDVTGTAKTQVGLKKSATEQARKLFCQQSKVLAERLKESSLTEVTSISIDWSKYESLFTYEESMDVEQLGRDLLQLINIAKTSIQDRKNIDQKSINQHSSIKGFVESLRQKNADAKTAEILVAKLKEALNIVSTQRKGYVENVLLNISTDVEIQYSKLHPGENIGKVRFFLKPNTIGSLEFDAQFQSKSDLPPQAYFSESHLDTLGICVFLALAKYYKTENTIIILDDVITSVDNVHLDRLMKLLHEESSLFNHVIITTHYRPWRDKYRYHQGPAAKVHFVELLNWTLAKGIRHTKTKLSVDELQEYLSQEPLDRQIVASKAGILLESLLDYLTILYQCRMPRRRDTNYVLGDLLTGIGKNLRKSLKVIHVDPATKKEEEKFLLDIINDLSGMSWLRNQVGCHWNILGGSVSDQDIDVFVKRTLDLAHHLICSHSGELPYRENPAGHWESRSGHIRLYPLNNPD